VNHLSDVMPMLSHFRNVHGQLQSSLAELQTRLNAVDVPVSGNVETIRGELRDAQVRQHLLPPSRLSHRRKFSFY